MARQALVDRLRRGLSRLKAFRSAKAGNVVITFALSLLPVIGLVGAGVDYSRAARIKTILQAAADAASLGSVAKVSQAYTAALAMSQDGTIAAGQAQALNIFNGEISGRGDFTMTSLTATVAKANWQITSTVQFTATVPTVLMEVLGWNNLTVSGSSTSANGMPTFIDFYLLLDNTPSMGLGATQTDINTLVNGTTQYTQTHGNGCAFACHDIKAANANPADLTNFDNFYQTAKNLGVTKRIDVLASATAQLMTTAANTEVVSNQFRVAIYTFGTWGSLTAPSDVAKSAASNYAPNRVVQLTPNLSNAGTAASQIDLMTVNANNENNDRATNFDSMFPAMSAIIPNPGTGQSAASPQAVLFFVSDGLADEPTPASCSGNNISGQTRCIEAIKASLCTAIKNRGIRIAVLYTTYLTLPSSGAGSDSWSNTNVMPYVPQVSPAMQACASPGLFFEVSPTQGISDAMNALFERAVATARLTQ
jgi:Flp pilus assembly protein TadG